MDVYCLPGYYCVRCYLCWCLYHQPQTRSLANWYSAEEQVWACLIIMGIGWVETSWQRKGPYTVYRGRVGVREVGGGFGVLGLINI